MDKAILYNVTLEKVEKRIQELNQIGFNVQKFEEIKNKIINKSNNNVEDSYNFANPELSLGQSAFLEQNYTNTINSLEKLYQKLLDYEVYVVAYHTTSLIKEFLDKKNKEEQDFIKYKEKLALVLKNLHNSKTLDYNVEGPIIEDIYSVIYLFIKEEIKCLGYSSLFSDLGEIDKYYLDKLVRKEVEEIDLKLAKNKLISLKIREIDAAGFENSYAQIDLITLLIENNLNYKERKTILNKLMTNLGNYQYSLEEIFNELNNLPQHMDKPKRTKRLIKNSLMLLINSALVTTLIVSSFKLGKNKSANETKTYMTTTTTYNPTNPNPYVVTEEYKTKRDDSILAIDYGSINDYGGREVTTYNLSNYIGTSLEKLYDMDLESFLVPENIKTLSRRDLSTEELTKEAFRIIKEVEVNLEDEKITVNNDELKKVFYTVVCLILSFVIYILYSILIDKIIDDYDYIPLLSDLGNLLEDIKSLKNYDNNLMEYKEKLRDIVMRLDTLIMQNKPLVEKAIFYTKELKNEGDYSEIRNDFEKRLSLIRKREKEVNQALKEH